MGEPRLAPRRSAERFAEPALWALALITRLPCRSIILHHWDSVNFALALEHYDVRLHQPHPPGCGGALRVLTRRLGQRGVLTLGDDTAGGQ